MAIRPRPRPRGTPPPPPHRAPPPPPPPPAPVPVPNLLEGVTEVEQFLSALVGGGGVPVEQGSVKGSSQFFVVNNGVRISFSAGSNKTLRGISIDGTNTVVSTSGVSFNTINGVTSYGDPSVIAIRGNSSNDKTGWFGPMNIDLPFGDFPGLKLFIDNGGAASCRVTLYWDNKDSQTLGHPHSHRHNQ